MRLRFLLAHACLAIVVLMIGTATAAPQATRLPNPSDPAATVPALKYESAFSDYKPFREQKANQWKQVNNEVADNPGMGSMEDMPGKPMRGTDSNSADTSTGKESAGGHDMDSMKGMSDKIMPDMDSNSADGPTSHERPADTVMAEEQTVPVLPDNAQLSGITGVGIVQVIDKANGKVKLSHDPIAALGWPKMTMFFRLKDSALADQVKEGDEVKFSLEKSASGYVISGWHRAAAGHDMNKMK